MLAVAVAAVALAAVALRDQWPDVRDALADVPPWTVVGAVVAACLAITASAEQQRHLLMAWSSDLPRPLVYRVFYASQLGKYLPGTAWAYVAQMELARDRGIERKSSAFAIVLGAFMTVATAFVVGAFSLDVRELWGWPEWIGWAAVAASMLATVVLAVRPTFVESIARWLLRRLRRQPPVTEPSGVRLRWALVWSVAAWIAYGTHLWLLAIGAGVDPVAGFPLAIGGFAAAWVVGFLVVFVPAGIGVREAVLVGVLVSAGMDTPSALAVSLVSRFVIIVAEVLLAVPSMLTLRGARGAA